CGGTAPREFTDRGVLRGFQYDFLRQLQFAARARPRYLPAEFMSESDLGGRERRHGVLERGLRVIDTDVGAADPRGSDFELDLPRRLYARDSFIQKAEAFGPWSGEFGLWFNERFHCP